MCYHYHLYLIVDMVTWEMSWNSWRHRLICSKAKCMGISAGGTDSWWSLMLFICIYLWPFLQQQLGRRTWFLLSACAIVSFASSTLAQVHFLWLKTVSSRLHVSFYENICFLLKPTAHLIWVPLSSIFLCDGQKIIEESYHTLSESLWLTPTVQSCIALLLTRFSQVVDPLPLAGCTDDVATLKLLF